MNKQLLLALIAAGAASPAATASGALAPEEGATPSNAALRAASRAADHLYDTAYTSYQTVLAAAKTQADEIQNAVLQQAMLASIEKAEINLEVIIADKTSGAGIVDEEAVKTVIEEATTAIKTLMTVYANITTVVNAYDTAYANAQAQANGYTNSVLKNSLLTALQKANIDLSSILSNNTLADGTIDKDAINTAVDAGTTAINTIAGQYAAIATTVADYDATYADAQEQAAGYADVIKSAMGSSLTKANINLSKIITDNTSATGLGTEAINTAVGKGTDAIKAIAKDFATIAKSYDDFIAAYDAAYKAVSAIEDANMQTAALTELQDVYGPTINGLSKLITDNTSATGQVTASNVTTVLDTATTNINNINTKYTGYAGGLNALQSALDAAIATAGDNYEDCVPYDVANLQAQAEDIQTDIKNWALEQIGELPAGVTAKTDEEIQKAIGKLTNAIDKSTGNATKYAKYLSNLKVLQGDLNKVQSPEGDFYVPVEDNSEGSALEAQIQAQIDAYNSAYNNTSVDPAKAMAAIVEATAKLATAVDTYVTNANAAVVWANVLSTAYNDYTAISNSVAVEFAKYKIYGNSTNATTFANAIAAINADIAQIKDQFTLANGDYAKITEISARTYIQLELEYLLSGVAGSGVDVQNFATKYPVSVKGIFENNKTYIADAIADAKTKTDGNTTIVDYLNALTVPDVPTVTVANITIKDGVCDLSTVISGAAAFESDIAKLNYQLYNPTYGAVAAIDTYFNTKTNIANANAKLPIVYKEIEDLKTAYSEYVDYINAQVGDTYKSLVNLVSNASDPSVVTETINDPFYVPTGEEGEVIPTIKVLVVSGGLVDLTANIEQLSAKITDIEKQIQKVEDDYDKLTQESIAANSYATTVISALNAADPDDATGLIAEAEEQYDALAKINNDIAAAYKNMFAGEGQSYADLSGDINDVRTKLADILGSCKDSVLAENTALINAALTEWVPKMMEAFNNATTTQEKYQSIKNEGFLDYLEENLTTDFDTYHKEIMDYYPKILKVSEVATKAINNQKVFTTEDINNYVVNDAEDYINALDAQAAALTEEVNNLANDYYTEVKDPVDKSFNVIYAQLVKAGLTDDTTDATLNAILQLAYNDILGAAETNIVLAEGIYAQATEDGVATGTLGENMDSILDALASAQKSLNSANVNASLTNSWNVVYQKYYEKIGTAESTFESYLPSEALQKKWDALVAQLEKLNEDFLPETFGEDVTTLLGYLTDAQDLLDAAEKANAGVVAAKAAFEKWNSTIVPALENSLLPVEQFVASLAGSGEEWYKYVDEVDYKTKYRNQYQQIEWIKSQIVENTSALVKLVPTGELTEAKVNTQKAYIDGLISNMWAKAANAETQFLQVMSGARVAYYFNYAKVAFDFNYVWPDGMTSGEKFPQNFNINETPKVDIQAYYNDVLKALQTTVDEQTKTWNADPADPKFNANIALIVSQAQALELQISQEIAQLASYWNNDPQQEALDEVADEFTGVDANLAGLNQYLFEGNGCHADVAESFKAQYEELQSYLVSIYNGYNSAEVALIAEQYNYIAQLNALDAAIEATWSAAQVADQPNVDNDINYAELTTQLEDLQTTLNNVQATVDTYNSADNYLPVDFANAIGTVQNSINTTTASVDELNGQLNEDKIFNACWSSISTVAEALYTLQCQVAYSESTLQYARVVKIKDEVYYNIITNPNQKVAPIYNEETGKYEDGLTYLTNLYNSVVANEFVKVLPPVTMKDADTSSQANANAYCKGIVANTIDTAIAAYLKFQAIVDLASDSQYIYGDIDGNGKVNVTDYAILVDYALMNAEDQAQLTDVQKTVADVNKDGVISIADVVALVKIIKGEMTEPMYAARRSVNTENQIRLVDMGATAQGRLIGVEIANGVAFAGTQFDIVLPAGVQIISEAVAERAQNMLLYTSDFDNTHRMLLATPEGGVISGMSGVVATFEVVGDGEINVINGEGADARGNSYELTSGAGLSGIESIGIDSAVDGEIFNLQGQKLNRLQPGVNIIRKTDGSSRKVMVK